jgi:hypothetical protein
MESLGILLKCISGFVGLGWSPEVRIYNKFPGRRFVVGPGTASGVGKKTDTL